MNRMLEGNHYFPVHSVDERYLHSRPGVTIVATP